MIGSLITRAEVVITVKCGVRVFYKFDSKEVIGWTVLFYVTG